MTTSDPAPESTTGLEPGGGLPPGEMPPAESSVSELSHHEDAPGRRVAPIVLIILAVFIVIVVAGAIIGAVQMF
jgi:hypothetical protein